MAFLVPMVKKMSFPFLFLAHTFLFEFSTMVVFILLYEANVIDTRIELEFSLLNQIKVIFFVLTNSTQYKRKMASLKISLFCQCLHYVNSKKIYKNFTQKKKNFSRLSSKQLIFIADIQVTICVNMYLFYSFIALRERMMIFYKIPEEKFHNIKTYIV